MKPDSEESEDSEEFSDDQTTYNTQYLLNGTAEGSDDDIYDADYIDNEYQEDQELDEDDELDYEDEDDELEKETEYTNQLDDVFQNQDDSGASSRRQTGTDRRVAFVSGSTVNGARSAPNGGINRAPLDTDPSDQSTSSSHTFSRSTSRSLSMLENQEADDDLVLGILRGVWAWLVAKTEQARDVLAPLRAAVFSFSLAKFSMAIVLFAVFVYIMAAALRGGALPGPRPFDASAAAPADIAEMVERLMAVEGEVSRLARRAASHDSARGDTDAQLTDVQQRLRGVAHEVEKVARQAGVLEKRAARAEAVAAGERERSAAEARTAAVQLSGVETRVQGLDAQIEELRRRVGHLEAAEKVEEVVLRTIDRVLPARLVVAKDARTGEIRPTPEFWKFLRAAFEDSLEQSPAIEQKIKKLVAKYPDLAAPSSGEKGGAAAEAEFGESTQRAVKSFMEEFLRENEDALARARALPEGAALVTRDVFSQLLQRELADMRDFTATSLAELETKLDQKFSRQAPAASSSQSKVLVQGTRAALNELIRAALDRYVRHTISKPDFADPATGATIEARLTSPPFDWAAHLALPRRAAQRVYNALGFGVMRTQPPRTAFSDDTRLGACWAFNGARGAVALRLGAQVFPEDLGIVHVAANTSSNPASAPRRVALWARVDDSRARTHLRRVLAAQQAPEPDTQTALGIPESYVRLVGGEYDLYGGDELQVFPVPAAVRRALAVAVPHGVSRVVFGVESNWGCERFTCVYRLRLFGSLAGASPGGAGSANGSGSTPALPQPGHVETGDDEDAELLPETDSEDGVVVEHDAAADRQFYLHAADLMPPKPADPATTSGGSRLRRLVGGFGQSNKNQEKGKVVVRGSLGGDVRVDARPDDTF